MTKSVAVWDIIISLFALYGMWTALKLARHKFKVWEEKTERNRRRRRWSKQLDRIAPDDLTSLAKLTLEAKGDLSDAAWLAREAHARGLGKLSA